MRLMDYQLMWLKVIDMVLIWLTVSFIVVFPTCVMQMFFSTPTQHTVYTPPSFCLNWILYQLSAPYLRPTRIHNFLFLLFFVPTSNSFLIFGSGFASDMMSYSLRRRRRCSYFSPLFSRFSAALLLPCPSNTLCVWDSRVVPTYTYSQVPNRNELFLWPNKRLLKIRWTN